MQASVVISSLFFFFSSRRRHTRCSRDWSSDVCSSDLRLRELTRRALELPQTAPEEQTDLHGILEGRGCWHLFGAPFERHMKWPTECNAVGAHRGPIRLNIARTARYWYPSACPRTWRWRTNTREPTTMFNANLTHCPPYYRRRP